MEQLFVRESLGFAVFEPLLSGLVAADIKIPYIFRYTIKILRFVYVNCLDL
jgi:hypothetical protein